VTGLPESIRTALFDLDGVLTPTAKLHAAAWKEMFDDVLRQRDGDGFRSFDKVADYDEYVDGKPRTDGTRDFLASRGIHLDDKEIEELSERKDEIFLAKVDTDGVKPYPGSLRYLHAVRDAGLRTAVVSSSRNCLQIIRSAGIEDLFDVRIDGVVAAEDNLRGKPHPDTFLAAAHRLRTEPVYAAVFEDATAGVAAGKAGDFGYIVGVNRIDGPGEHGHSDDLSKHGATVVVRDLEELLA
jgi:beta-phosphoglucomutase family hydrolase